MGNTCSATCDFYFRSRKHQISQYAEIDITNDNQLSQLSDILTEGTLLILVRDIPLPLLKRLLQENFPVAGIVWFADDDFSAAGLDETLPKPYRKKLQSWYQKAKPYLTRLCSEIWVSTPYLAEKYQLSEKAVLPPVEPKAPVNKPVIRCFYHGSSSHTQEWAFLQKVIESVQARNSNTLFEVIGDHALYKTFRNIPRVQVLHPMSWSDYLIMTSSRAMDIGLAPLMDTPFNLARSHTKFLDICRQQAVGIYSERFPVAESIKTHNAGLVVSDSVEEWVASIECLLSSDRDVLYRNAEKLKRTLHTSHLPLL